VTQDIFRYWLSNQHCLTFISELLLYQITYIWTDRHSIGLL